MELTRILRVPRCQKMCVLMYIGMCCVLSGCNLDFIGGYNGYIRIDQVNGKDFSMGPFDVFVFADQTADGRIVALVDSTKTTYVPFNILFEGGVDPDERKLILRSSYVLKAGRAGNLLNRDVIKTIVLEADEQGVTGQSIDGTYTETVEGLQDSPILITGSFHVSKTRSHIFVEDQRFSIEGSVKEGGTGVPTILLELHDHQGNLIATQVTDATGDYNFPLLTRGPVYRVAPVKTPDSFVFTPSAHENLYPIEDDITANFVLNRNPGVQVSFVGIPDEGNAPLLVGFYDLSPTTVGATYEWDFDDGTTDTERNPTHFFEVPGRYEVTLTIPGVGMAARTVLVGPPGAPNGRTLAAHDFGIGHPGAVSSGPHKMLVSLPGTPSGQFGNAFAFGYEAGFLAGAFEEE